MPYANSPSGLERKRRRTQLNKLPAGAWQEIATDQLRVAPFALRIATTGAERAHLADVALELAQPAAELVVYVPGPDSQLHDPQKPYVLLCGKSYWEGYTEVWRHSPRISVNLVSVDDANAAYFALEHAAAKVAISQLAKEGLRRSRRDLIAEFALVQQIKSRNRSRDLEFGRPFLGANRSPATWPYPCRSG